MFYSSSFNNCFRFFDICLNPTLVLKLFRFHSIPLLSGFFPSRTCWLHCDWMTWTPWQSNSCRSRYQACNLHHWGPRPDQPTFSEPGKDGIHKWCRSWGDNSFGLINECKCRTWHKFWYDEIFAFNIFGSTVYDIVYISFHIIPPPCNSLPIVFHAVRIVIIRNSSDCYRKCRIHFRCLLCVLTLPVTLSSRLSRFSRRSDSNSSRTIRITIIVILIIIVVVIG